jgi:hypothetical protein
MLALLAVGPAESAGSDNQATWIQYLPLITAGLAAIVAILAAKLSVRFASRRQERNAALALLAEITAIRTAIQALCAEQSQTTYVQSSYLSRPDQLCTVYRSVGTSLGLLEPECLRQVVTFYGSVLTLTSLRNAPPDSYSQQDLARVIAAGELCEATLTQTYVDGSRRGPHDR